MTDVGITQPDAAGDLRLTRPLLGAWSRTSAAWLVALVAASTVVRGVIGLNVASAWIFPDELLYTDLARGLADSGLPAVRGNVTFGWGVVYPVLIAPAWLLFDDPFWAYRAALFGNALLMSLAALPAYHVARLFVSRRASFGVAVLAVLVPSMAYTGVVMTENAFYPVFLVSLFAIARAVRDPSVMNQTLALLSIGLAALTRIQGVSLLIVLAAAVGIYALAGVKDEKRTYLRRLTPTAAVIAACAVGPFFASLLRGEGILGWLSGRSGTFDGLKASEVPEWFLYLTGDLVLYVALVPAAATAIVVARGMSRRSAETFRLFAAISLPTFAVTLGSISVVSASFDVDGVENLNERYVFYVVPLAFIGLAMWIDARLPRPRPWSWLVVAICCLLPMLLPVKRLEYNADFQTLAMLPWTGLSLSSGALALGIGLFLAACAALWLSCPSTKSSYLVLFSAIGVTALSVFVAGSNGVTASDSAKAFAGLSATWVDDVVPNDAEAVVIWDEGETRRVRADSLSYPVMVTEVFNRKVGPVYRLGRSTHYENVLPTIRVETRSDGTVVDDRGRPVRARYVLTTCRTGVLGELVGQAAAGRLRLIEVGGPIRVVGARRCDDLATER